MTLPKRSSLKDNELRIITKDFSLKWVVFWKNKPSCPTSRPPTVVAFKPAFLHLLDKDEDEDIVDDEVDALKPAFLRLLMMRLSL